MLRIVSGAAKDLTKAEMYLNELRDRGLPVLLHEARIVLDLETATFEQLREYFAFFAVSSRRAIPKKWRTFLLFAYNVDKQVYSGSAVLITPGMVDDFLKRHYRGNDDSLMTALRMIVRANEKWYA